MMDGSAVLPNRFREYLQEVGVRAFDRLAETVDDAGITAGAQEQTPAAAALQALLREWRGMAPEEKRSFAAKLVEAIVDVTAVSAAIPAGVAVGRKLAKAARKKLKKRKKKLKKAAKKEAAAVDPAKKGKKKKGKKK